MGRLKGTMETLLTTIALAVALPAHAQDDNKKMLEWIDREIREIRIDEFKRVQKLCRVDKRPAYCPEYERMLESMRKQITGGKPAEREDMGGAIPVAPIDSK